MNLSRCFAPRQLLFLFAAGLLTSGARLASGQETITLRDGTTQDVTVQGVTSSGVRVQLRAGVTLVEPFANITKLTMNAPAEYAAAEVAFEKGDLKTALANEDSVVKSYRGLPTEWAQRATLTLGDIYVALDQLPQAEAAYNDYLKMYPGAGTAEVNVGMARIDVSKKNFDAAKAKIDPILTQGIKLRNPPKVASTLIGRAFYVSGQIKDATGDLPGALEDYLRTVTIFPEDRVAAAGAQARADAIRKDHGTSVP